VVVGSRIAEVLPSPDGVVRHRLRWIGNVTIPARSPMSFRPVVGGRSALPPEPPIGHA
jgi:hypothetical protein